MAANQQFCLRWNNHQRTLISVFDSLLESGTLVDCTLAAEGQYLNAHKVVLSACSPYLGVLLSSHHEKHPILILKDIKFQELKAMLDYMYRGEVNISQEQLCTFLKAAESLQIKGLTESAGLNPETKDFEERLVKRYDRKCTTPQIPNHNARTRSPPSSNAVNTTSEHSWNQKYSSSNYRSISPARRDGSLSPTARKRRKQQHPMSSVDDAGNTPTTTATSTSLPVVENHQDTVDNVSSSNTNTLSVNVNNIKAENSDKLVDNETRSTDSGSSSTTNSAKAHDLPVVPKQEPRFDDRHSDNEGGYEDSVEEMTIEDEEEEIDETDLSRPGPSHSEDSQNYGSNSYPLSSVNDGTSGQLDCQEPITDPLAEQRFVCRLCGKLYQWKQSLTRHIREDRCDKGPQHACPRCGIIFKHTTRLNRHILFCPNVQLGGHDSNLGAITTPSTIVENAISQVQVQATQQSQISTSTTITTTSTSASASATENVVASVATTAPLSASSLSSPPSFMSPTTTLM